MNYENATNDDLEVKLAELIGMDSLSALNAPKYCTNWNATMPLAVEYGISSIMTESITDNGFMYEAFYMNGHISSKDGELHVCSLFNTTDIDPLRAIVICLIKVLENEDDSGQK